MGDKPGHRALRRGRVSQSGGVYHVTFTTHDRQPLFTDYTLARIASKTFVTSARAGSATLLCWVLMPDHFHGLIQLQDPVALSPVVQRMKSISTRECHARQPNTRIWARTFHDHAMRRDEDLRQTARYIVANPIRAGLAATAGEYPFWDAVWV